MSIDVNSPTLSVNIMAENKDYKSDMDHAIFYVRNLLAALGIWPLVKQNSCQTQHRKRELILTTLLITTGMLLMAFVMIPIAVFIILKTRSITGFLKMLGPIVIYLSTFTKYCLYIYRRNSIKLCFEHVEIDWKMALTAFDREIMRKKAVLGRRICALSMIFIYTTSLLYVTLLPISRGRKARALNQSGRILPYNVYDLYLNPRATPQYQTLFLLSFLSGCVMYTVRVASCCLVAIFVSHACGQIEIIISRLDTLFDNLNDDIELLNTRVSFIVRNHVRVLRLIGAIEAAFKEIFLTKVISSTLIICMLGWRLTQWKTSDNVAKTTYLIALISLMLNLFLFCYSSELLIERCAMVGKATYLSDWWKMRGKSGRALVLLISMAQIPRSLSAGGMMELSVASFGSIVRTSVAYLNLLRTFNL